MKVGDVWTRDPVCCTPETALYAVARLMIEYDCGAIPVVNNYRSLIPLGIITDRDIVCRSVACADPPQDTRADACMSYPVFTIHPDADLAQCCHIMEHNHIRRIVVVDEHRACCGIVSMADVAIWAPDLLTAEVIRSVSLPPKTATRFPVRA